MNRGNAKEATDLLDIVHLALDRRSIHTLNELKGAHPILRADAALRARHWFSENANRTVQLMRSVPDGRDTDLETVQLVHDLLITALSP